MLTRTDSLRYKYSTRTDVVLEPMELTEYKTVTKTRSTFRLVCKPLFRGERTQYGLTVRTDSLERAHRAFVETYPAARLWYAINLDDKYGNDTDNDPRFAD